MRHPASGPSPMAFAGMAWCHECGLVISVGAIMGFSVSTAKVDITPTPAVPNPFLAGYGTDDGGRQVTDPAPYAPLYARAVVIWDDGAPNLLLAADILAFPDSVHKAALAGILGLAGWSASDIVLQATHTHNGPVLVDTLDPYITYGITDLGQIQAYTAWLQGQIVDVARSALTAAQTPVTLDYQVASQTFAVNRVGLSYTETDVPVLVARGEDGSPVAIVFGYGCHPVAAGWMTQYDGDYPAGACTYIEQNTDAFALFLQGAGGDQNPGGIASWALRNQCGTSLGAAVVAAAVTPGRALTGPIGTASNDVALPLDIDLSPGNLAAVRADYAARVPNPLGHPPWYARHAEVMIQRLDAGQIETGVPSAVQRWTIGGAEPLKIAWASGELVSSYAAFLRIHFGGSAGLWVCGYAGASLCYIPTAEFFPPTMTLGSYEGGWDTDFPGIAGGSMTVYGHPAHYVAGASGVGATVIAALTQILT